MRAVDPTRAAPPGDVAVVLDRVKDRLDVHPVVHVAAGQVENGHVVGERLGGAGERVLGARAHLRREHADPVAVRSAAEPVRDGHPDAFLPAYHWPYADLAQASISGWAG